MKKKDKIAFLVQNKEDHISQKKAKTKEADGVLYYKLNDTIIDTVSKADISQIDLTNTNALNVKAIINTTNIMDTHDDVHIPGIWTKSIQEAKNILHLQEHDNSFRSIIASGQDLNVYAKYYDWRDLGYDYDGQTQALEFDSNVKKSRNEFMFNQYANNYVTNHSVGMQYVKIFLAVDDPDFPNEHEVWNRYIDMIVNKELPIEKGYFYAVTEAKIIEGSAVPIGSNHVTPTRSVTPKLTQLELELQEQKEILNRILNKINGDKPSEPGTSTQNDDTYIDLLKQINYKLK